MSEQFWQIYIITILVLSLWSVPWKAVALWKAARLGQKGWFVLMFILNTVAILEIIYIFKIAKKKENKEVSSNNE